MTDGLQTLTARELNRALLARQHLLERSTLPMNRVIEDVGGLQTQYAPAAYVGLWSRMADFERASLTRAMETREVIHGTLMRVTIHTVTAPDYWPMAIGVRESRREWARRTAGSELDEDEAVRMADAVREIVGSDSMKVRELTARLLERGFSKLAIGRVGLWIDLVRVPPSGTWERRANDIYALAEAWLPVATVATRSPTVDEGMTLLLERYLGGFGPARIHDFANWAGITLPRARRAAERIELRRFRDEEGRELVDLPGAPLPDPSTPAPVRFLAPYDPTMLSNCRRTQVLPEALRPVVFNAKTPYPIGTILVDGSVAGMWRFEADKVTTRIVVPLPRKALRDVEDEAATLAGFASSKGHT